MIEIIEIKGKKFRFIDEMSFGYHPGANEDHPEFYIGYTFRKREKLGERMMY